MKSENSYQCIKCRVITQYIPIIDDSIPEEILLRINARYSGLDEFALMLNDNVALCYINGQYYMVKQSAEAGEADALQTVKNAIMASVTHQNE